MNTMKENIFEIKNGILLHCTVNNPKVVIPDGVTEIDSEAFRQPDSIYGLDEVTSLSIPESVVKIGSGAFQWCKKLKKASIKGPAEIGSEAFLGCSSLKEVYLADGVRSIGSDCFSFCEKLQYLFIPESVETMGYEIARQNDGTIRQPTFRCYSKGIGKGWSKDWNLIHFDRRFWDNPDYYYYHPTFFGVTRNGTARTDISHQPAIGMPHGTGVKAEEPKARIEGHHLPKTKLRLWLTATLISMVGEKEYLLDEEERDILPRINRDNDNATLRPLDEPWEITVDDSTRHLAPELKISAWINDYYDIFDGHTLIVHHDMPWHNDRYKYYPISKLSMGGTVIAEKHIMNGGYIYDVRLHIHWPEQEYRKYSLNEASDLIKEQLAEWGLNDTDNEVDALLAHSHWKAEEYKSYKPSELPAKLMDDIKADGEKWADLGQIVLQPYEFYEETHSYSDDYKDVASAYGMDCDDWTTTERRKTKGSFAIEMKSKQ